MRVSCEGQYTPESPTHLQRSPRQAHWSCQPQRAPPTSGGPLAGCITTSAPESPTDLRRTHGRVHGYFARPGEPH